MNTKEKELNFSDYRRTHKHTAPKVIDWKDKTILVVEDIPSNYQLLDAYLSRTGAKLIHVENGIQAIDVMKGIYPIDLIIMDIRLPKLNGLVATREIRKFHPKLPIIAQTAFAMPSDRDLCINAGCNEFIAKPFRKSELLDILEQYL